MSMMGLNIIQIKLRPKKDKDQQEWIEEAGKHYCTDCYSYDDEDKLIIKLKNHE